MQLGTKQKIITGLKATAALAAGAAAVFVGYQAVKGEQGNGYARGLETAFSGAGTGAIAGAVVGAGVGLLSEPTVNAEGKQLSKLQSVTSLAGLGMATGAATGALSQTAGFLMDDNNLGG